MAGKEKKESYTRKALRKATNLLSCLCFPPFCCREFSQNVQKEEEVVEFSSPYWLTLDGSPTLRLLMKLENEGKLDTFAYGGMVSGPRQTLRSLMQLEDRDALLLDRNQDGKDQFLETSEAALVVADAEEKEIEISARSSSAATSCMTPARSSKLIGGDLSTAHTATKLSPPVATLPGTDDFTNELKMEIEDMKIQLSNTYSDTFAGLQMGRELGSGSFGTVYEAVTGFEKVAIKVLRADKMATLTESNFYMNMHEFYGEAVLLSKLIHPNILSFKFMVSAVPPNGLPGMATDFMSDDLFRFTRRAGGLKSWKSVWNIAKQVADGLKYMHSKKIVHFDIKSSNILLNYGASPALNILTCKVADFGHAVENYYGVMRLNSQRGTTRYMAPEVLRASQTGMELVTNKVDVYSYGILLWELIIGVLPYNNIPYDQIGPLVVKGLRPNVPSWCDLGWKTLMENCWSQDQSRRPSFDKIVEHLDSLLGSS